MRKNKHGATLDEYGLVVEREIGEHDHRFPKKFIGSITQPDQVISQCQVCGEWHKFKKKDFLNAINAGKTQ